MKGKKRIPFILGLMLCLIMPMASAGKLIIKMGSIAPEGSAWHDALLRLKQDWRDLSDGQLELRIYPGGVLGGEGEMVRKIQRRGLDAIAVSGSGLPMVDDSIHCLNLPLLFDSYENFDYVRAGISPIVEARLEKKGYKVLTWTEGGWVNFFTKEAVRTPQDLRKLRLWISSGDPDTERILKELGFNVVPLPTTDMLTGLQTGLIEAIDVPPLFALLDRSYEYAPYMTDFKWAPLNAAIIISASTWKKIPARLHEKLLLSAQAIGQGLREEVRSSSKEAVKEMQARGLKVIVPTTEDLAHWQTLTDESFPKIRGTLCEADIFDQVIRLDQAYEQKHQ